MKYTMPPAKAEAAEAAYKAFYEAQGHSEENGRMRFACLSSETQEAWAEAAQAVVYYCVHRIEAAVQHDGFNTE